MLSRVVAGTDMLPPSKETARRADRVNKSAALSLYLAENTCSIKECVRLSQATHD